MKKTIMVIVLMVILLSNNIVYAYSTTEIGKLKSHTNSVYSSIKERLNITDEDIKKAKKNGRTAFDLGRDKGVSEEELRSCIILDAEKSLDKIVFMPKFAKNKVKDKVRNSIKNWDGYFD